VTTRRATILLALHFARRAVTRAIRPLRGRMDCTTSAGVRNAATYAELRSVDSELVCLIARRSRT
jgi:hypothetical protein